MSDGLYTLYFETHIQSQANVAESGASLQTWHERCGHCSYKTIRKMSKGNAVNGKMVVTDIGNSESDNLFCEACIFGKHYRKPFNESDTRASKPAELIHLTSVAR